MDTGETIEHTVGEAEDGSRLDVFLAEVVEDATRSFLQKLIKDAQVSVNGKVCCKPRQKVRDGDAVAVVVPPPPPVHPQPEDIPLDILHEDDALLIVNKAAGMVVHPAPGHHTGTLVNAVLHHCKKFADSGVDATRPGIVHRLDRFTSGVMVVAKTQTAFTHLAAQASAHTFDRRYLALVRGEFKENSGKISAGIGRSLTDRSRMAVTGVRAKDAVTHFEVIERLGQASLVALQLDTGRTHQIRVHMRFAGRPVLGDATYGVTDFSRWGISDAVRAALEALPGQALHAERLGIEHPTSGQRLHFSAPPPEAFEKALEALRTVLA